MAVRVYGTICSGSWSGSQKRQPVHRSGSLTSGVPDHDRARKIICTQPEQHAPLGVLQMEMRPDDVQHGPLRRFRRGAASGDRRIEGDGMRARGVVAAHEVEGGGADPQSGENVGGEPGQHHALGQGEVGGVAVPPARVDLDGDRRAVAAAGFFGGERRELGHMEVCFFPQLPADGLLQGPVLRFPASSQQRPGPRLPDAGDVIAQVQEVLACVVVNQRRGVHRAPPGGGRGGRV